MIVLICTCWVVFECITARIWQDGMPGNSKTKRESIEKGVFVADVDSNLDTLLMESVGVAPQQIWIEHAWVNRVPWIGSITYEHTYGYNLIARFTDEDMERLAQSGCIESWVLRFQARGDTIWCTLGMPNRLKFHCRNVPPFPVVFEVAPSR